MRHQKGPRSDQRVPQLWLDMATAEEITTGLCRDMAGFMVSFEVSQVVQQRPCLIIALVNRQIFRRCTRFQEYERVRGFSVFAQWN